MLQNNTTSNSESYQQNLENTGEMLNEKPFPEYILTEFFTRVATSVYRSLGTCNYFVGFNYPKTVEYVTDTLGIKLHKEEETDFWLRGERVVRRDDDGNALLTIIVLLHIHPDYDNI
jgi:hypothetical protein